MRFKWIFLVLSLCISFGASSKEAIYEDIDFVYYLQLEIATCVVNFKSITNQPQSHDLFLNECRRIVVNSNKLGKIDFLYKTNDSSHEGKKKLIESCSEKLRVPDFINCVYGS